MGNHLGLAPREGECVCVDERGERGKDLKRGSVYVFYDDPLAVCDGAGERAGLPVELSCFFGWVCMCVCVCVCGGVKG